VHRSFLLAFAIAASACGQIEVYHKTASVEIGTTQQFSAYVPLSPNTVVWSVNGITGGNSTIGTVSQTGLYTAPVTAPMSNVVALRATSTAFPEKFGEATITITRKKPWVWSVSPAITAGTFNVKVNGSNFAPDAIAKLNGITLTTTYLSSTSLQIAGTAVAGTAFLTVTLPAPGAVASQPLTVTVAGAPSITVTVSPPTATLVAGATQAFAANTPVTWQASAGMITSGGVFTAPATPQTVTVTATSTMDATKSATATVTVQAAPFTISPTSATLVTGATQTFTASAAATWQASAGTITAGGVFTAPPTPQTVTVTAKSTADPTKTASATVSVASGGTQTFTASGPATWQASGGTITAGGLFTAPAIASTVSVTATSTLDPAKSATATVTVTGPAPLVSRITAARLLEQATFGPRPSDIAKVQQMGVAPWIDEQLALSETPIPDAADTGALRRWALYNYTHAPDQLRQRLTYALSQIVVVSLNKNIYPNEILPWMRIMQKNAFGNYKQILKEVSVSPSMGK